MQQPITRGIIDIKVQANAAPMGKAPVPISTNPTVTKNSPPIIQQQAKQPKNINSPDILHDITSKQNF